MVLAHGIEWSGAEALSQRMAAALRPQTASIGIACFAADGITLDDLCRTADSELYRAKYARWLVSGSPVPLRDRTPPETS